MAGCDSHEARAGGWKFFSIITDRMQRVWFPFVPGQRIPFLAGMYSKLQHVKLKALLFIFLCESCEIKFIRIPGFEPVV